MEDFKRKKQEKGKKRGNFFLFCAPSLFAVEVKIGVGDAVGKLTRRRWWPKMNKNWRRHTPLALLSVVQSKSVSHFHETQTYIRKGRYSTVEIFCERKVITVISVAGCFFAGQAKQYYIYNVYLILWFRTIQSAGSTINLWFRTIQSTSFVRFTCFNRFNYLF